MHGTVLSIVSNAYITNYIYVTICLNVLCRTLQAMFKKHSWQTKVVKVLRLVLTSVCETLLAIKTAAYIAGVTARLWMTPNYYLMSISMCTLDCLNIVKLPIVFRWPSGIYSMIGVAIMLKVLYYVVYFSIVHVGYWVPKTSLILSAFHRNILNSIVT